MIEACALRCKTRQLLNTIGFAGRRWIVR